MEENESVELRRAKDQQRPRNRSDLNLEKIDEHSESSDTDFNQTWPPSKSLFASSKSSAFVGSDDGLLTPDYKPRPKSTSFSTSLKPPIFIRARKQKKEDGSLGPHLNPISVTQSCIDVSSTSMRPSSSLYNVDNVVKNKYDSKSKSTSQLDSVGYDMKPKGRRLDGNLKSNLIGNRSISSPVMNTDASRSFEDLATEDDDAVASNSINKKFHKLFKNVAEDERVLDRYACALVSDILLQGQIYITDNYFAFYSNVLFGHVTRVLLPLDKVLDIRKVKMVKVIPNAIKVITNTKKFTFGSLLSREATFKLMWKVWKRQKQQERDSVSQTSSERVSVPSEEEEIDDGTGVSLNTPSVSDEMANERVISALNLQIQNGLDQPDGSNVSSLDLVDDKTGAPKSNYILGILDFLSPVHWLKSRLKASVNILNRLPRTTVFLAMCTVVLIFLYVSALFLIFRLNMIYGHTRSDATAEENSYLEVFNFKTHLHSASINQLQDALNTQIRELVDVRKSLETLRLVTAASVQPEETFQKSTVESVLKN